MRSTLYSLLLLSACSKAHVAPSGTLPPSDGGFIDGLTVSSTSPAASQVNASRGADLLVEFSADMDETTTLAAISFSPAIACDAVVSGARYTCAHAPLLAATKYTVVIDASARDGKGRELAAPFVYSFTSTEAGSPSITSVHVENQAGRQVRQGVGQVTLDVQGIDLDTITAAHAGMLDVTVTSTSTLAKVVVTVPPGQMLGTLDLQLESIHGGVSFADALEITDTKVDVAAGDDVAAGTPEAPFRTLTHTLASVNGPTRVLLAAGTYSSATGEVWPTGSATNVPDGVTLVGAAMASVVLEGDAGDTVALSFMGTGSVSGLDIAGFRNGIVAGDGTNVSLSDMAIEESTASGVVATGNAIVGCSAEIRNSAGPGLMATGTATLLVNGGRFLHNRTGAWLGDAASIAGNDVVFDSNGTTNEPSHSGVYLRDGASASFTNSTFSNNFTAGLYSSAISTVKLTGGEIMGNGKPCTGGVDGFANCNGLVLAATTQSVYIDGTRIHDNHYYGINAIGSHLAFSMINATVSSHPTANVSFAETGGFTLFPTTVMIANSAFSGPTDVNLRWGGEMKHLAITGSRFTDGTNAHLEDHSDATSNTTFTDLTLDGVFFPSNGAQTQTVTWQDVGIPKGLGFATGHGSMHFYKQ